MCESSHDSDSTQSRADGLDHDPIEALGPLARANPRFSIWYPSLWLSFTEQLTNGETFVFVDDSGDEHAPGTIEDLFEGCKPGSRRYGELQLWDGFWLLVYGIAHWASFSLMHALLLIQWGIHQAAARPQCMGESEEPELSVTKLLFNMCDGATILLRDVLIFKVDPIHPDTKLRLSRGFWNAKPTMDWQITRDDLFSFVDRNYPDFKASFREFMNEVGSHGPPRQDPAGGKDKPVSRDTLLKLVLGMAMRSFGYIPGSRNPATGKGQHSIEAAMALENLKMDRETIKRVLDEATRTIGKHTRRTSTTD